jgi:acetyl-CoA acyltransferase
MDEFAAESHRRAAATRDGGGFADEIVAVEAVERDETIRDATTSQGLGQLKPSFADEAMSARFAEIQWSVTAGNSSQLADGASVLLLTSAKVAARLNLKPRARFVAYDVIGDDPIMMLTAPIVATRRILAKSGVALSAIGHFEVNEAFACVPLAWQQEFDVDPKRLNPNGGAIALGHPLGASGARLMTTLVHALARGNARYGLQTMCEAGGLANATLIERL